MRDLVLAVSLSVLVLMIVIIAYFMLDIIVTTNDNIEHNKQLVIDQSVFTLSEIGENISGMTGSPKMIGLFNQDVINDILAGDWDAFYDFIGDFAINFYPIDYVGVIRDGEVVSYKTSDGSEVDTGQMPASSQETYETLTQLGDKEGLFVSVLYPIDLSIVGLSEFSVNMIADRTEELAAVEQYFEDQRNALILRLSIVSIAAIIITLLLTTLGLRYFTRKYVVNPIEELNRTAEEIADGTFKGEVKVDEDSAYAALQGLLRSGQKVLSRMGEEMRE
jgi:HAMP domain-containing protein